MNATGDTDGNPSTEPDPSWLSYQITPAYPDYTCGLTTNTGAAAEVLRRYFKTDDIACTFTALSQGDQNARKPIIPATRTKGGGLPRRLPNS